jgi:hypothetical protein
VEKNKKTKPIKKYSVIVMLSSYGRVEIEAANKKDAEKQAYDMDRTGQIDYGDQEIEKVIVEALK